MRKGELSTSIAQLKDLRNDINYYCYQAEMISNSLKSLADKIEAQVDVLEYELHALEDQDWAANS